MQMSKPLYDALKNNEYDISVLEDAVKILRKGQEAHARGLIWADKYSDAEHVKWRDQMLTEYVDSAKHAFNIIAAEIAEVAEVAATRKVVCRRDADGRLSLLFPTDALPGGHAGEIAGWTPAGFFIATRAILDTTTPAPDADAEALLATFRKQNDMPAGRYALSTSWTAEDDAERNYAYSRLDAGALAAGQLFYALRSRAADAEALLERLSASLELSWLKK